VTVQAGHVGTKSVLFTDLVGSTELRVRVGEAAADTLRRAHDALCTEAITAHGGTVVKGLGDGLMATFDSAADAVAGAVALQQAADTYSRDDPDRAFTLRVGCSIGDVSTENGDVFGVPVVEASRLCAAAAGGEILAADLVRALARGRGEFVFEPMGEMTLKGLPEPVSAARVVWEPLIEPTADVDTDTIVPLPAALLGAVTAYIGREALRDRLVAVWQDARSGACSTILLAGEPGVGKTRTAAELARLAYADGGLVLYGRCDEELGVPYQPFVEALDHYVQHQAAPVLGRLPGELTRLVPGIANAVAGVPAAVASDPASEEYRLFEATASWLIEAARATDGMLVVLDDIHWATKPTLQLLLHAVRRATDESAPLVILATYRDTDIDRNHPLASMLGDLRRLPGVDRIAIENLDGAEVIEFIETAAGHELDEPTRRLAEEVYAETEGNPFFVGEVLRHLIETGGVHRVGDRWTVAEGKHVTVPEGVRDVVGRRLNRLSDTANDVLSVASVFGRDFEIAPLFDVVDATDNAVLDALDQAVRARLIEETGVDRYRFAHALVRTTLYEELSATRRRRLHRQIADVLEKLRPDDVRALARHCIEGGPDGGDVSRAVRYTIAAAQQSMQARAFAEAEAGFLGAIELIDDSGNPATELGVEALIGLGEAQRDQGNPAFRLTLLDASQRADDLGAVALLERAVLANTRGYASIIGDVDEERLAFIERALDLTGAEPSQDRALLTALLGMEVTFSGDHARRLAIVTEAESMARSLGDRGLLARVMVMTAWARTHGKAWESLVETSAETVELADETGDPTMRVIARLFRGGALLTADRIEESERVTREMVAIADEDAAPFVRWAARSNAIRVPILHGDLDAAEAANNAELAIAQELEQSDGPQWWASTIMGITWLRGNGGSFADVAGPFAEQYSRSKIWRCAQAWLLSQAGRADEARQIISDYALDAVETIDDPWPFVGASQLAFASWKIGESQLAARVVVALEPYRSCWTHYYLVALGPVSWPLGVALAATGRLDEAVDSLDEALDRVRRHNFVAYQAGIEVDLAEVLTERGAAGDAERATSLLAEAREHAEAVGATGLIARIDEAS
jgi:class 3 adenylate cyclase/tetratricopeptide (TPR) repeat protein